MEPEGRVVSGSRLSLGVWDLPYRAAPEDLSGSAGSRGFTSLSVERFAIFEFRVWDLGSGPWGSVGPFFGFF